MVDNGTYGYERALNEDDIKQGKAVKSLAMMRYVGNKNGTYIILILGKDPSNSAVANRVSCQSPCKYAKSEVLMGDEVVSTETLPADPSSIMGAMLEDAVNGQLTPYGQDSDSIAMPQQAPTPPAPVTQEPVQQVSASQGSAPEIVPPPVAPQAETPSQASSTDYGPASSARASDQTYQTSFDCSAARTLTEYLICHDPDLAASDRELGDIYQQAKVAATNKDAFAARVRKQWNYREKTCHDKECLVAWYAYQKDALTKIAQTGDVNVQ
ncbi:lysozyme inhibitor LprI family protein [Paraburkholderia fungorum]|nr:hypothetical protein [Paraburkholderia fungorum]